MLMPILHGINFSTLVSRLQIIKIKLTSGKLHKINFYVIYQTVQYTKKGAVMDGNAQPANANAPPKLNITNPQTDEDFFAIGRFLAQRYSTCLKTNTAALIVSDEKQIISWGVNMCSPQGQLYGIPVTECPRQNAVTGTSYAICMPMHAEIVACLNAFGINTATKQTLWHFAGFSRRLKEYCGFFGAKGAVMYLVGHYWACEECKQFLAEAGITDIKFDDLSGGSTLKQYRERGISDVPKHSLDVSGSILSGIVTVQIAPNKLPEFCKRNSLAIEQIKLFPTQDDIFVIPVENGQEATLIKRFKDDPDVRNAGAVSLK